MDAGNLQDKKWLLAAALYLLSAAGLWVSLSQLKAVAAFKRLDAAYDSVRARMRLFGLLSLFLAAAMAFFYWKARPFNGLLWAAVFAWYLYTVYLSGRGLSVLKNIARRAREG